MPPWIYIWIARWMGGERFRRATSEDYRFWYGVLFLTPVLMTVFMTLGRDILDTGGTFALWVLVTVSGLISCVVFLAWARFTPAKISLLLSIVSWGGFFLLWP